MSQAGKGPLRLGEALRQYLDRSGIGERVEEAGVLPEWAARVGPAIAGVTTPLRVSHGTLVVAVRSSAWLSELRLMSGEILRRLNEGREAGRIQRLRFVLAEAGTEPPAGG
jgi:predicted nucleic acid-binding Zn ribbon protein